MRVRELRIRESQIEDVLATYPDITKEILGISEDLTLIARQKVLSSGDKLDLLFVAGTKIKLLELKVSLYKAEFLKQTIQYKDDILKLQNENKLINGQIDTYLLCPSIPDRERQLCLSEKVQPIEYSPKAVLDSFFARLKNLADFIIMKPAEPWSMEPLFIK